MRSPKIAVIGAGMGGLTAATLLQRAGFDVTVYEQAPEIARIGAGISLGPNVMKIMRHIGLSDTIYQIGMVPRQYLSREWDTGRTLFEIPVARWAEKFGMSSLFMHRGDLQAILATGVQPDSIKLNMCMVGMDTQGERTRLTFANGQVADYDIVIGADGVNSAVREILLGAEPPTYTGFVAYRAIFPTHLLPRGALTADSSKWWSDERLPADEDRHFITYHLSAKRDEVYFVTGSPDPNWDEGISSVPVDISEILECYEGFAPEVMEIIAACPKASKWPLLERNPLPLWSQGNIVMLGDACHPMKPHMGQGANMAMEDAMILARCIVAADGDFPAAFDTYRQSRFARASRVQRESHENTWMKYETDPSWVFAYDAVNVPLGAPPVELTAPRTVAAAV